MGRENEVDNPPAGRGESTTKSHTNRTAVWEATRRRENAVEDAGERERERTKKNRLSTAKPTTWHEEKEKGAGKGGTTRSHNAQRVRVETNTRLKSKVGKNQLP